MLRAQVQILDRPPCPPRHAPSPRPLQWGRRLTARWITHTAKLSKRLGCLSCYPQRYWLTRFGAGRIVGITVSIGTSLGTIEAAPFKILGLDCDAAATRTGGHPPKESLVLPLKTGLTSPVERAVRPGQCGARNRRSPWAASLATHWRRWNAYVRERCADKARRTCIAHYRRVVRNDATGWETRPLCRIATMGMPRPMPTCQSLQDR